MATIDPRGITSDAGGRSNGFRPVPALEEKHIEPERGAGVLVQQGECRARHPLPKPLPRRARVRALELYVGSSWRQDWVLSGLDRSLLSATNLKSLFLLMREQVFFSLTNLYNLVTMRDIESSRRSPKAKILHRSLVVVLLQATFLI